MKIIKLKDKYMQDFLKFVGYQDNMKIRTANDGTWTIYDGGELIGSFNPSSNEIQIFDEKILLVMINYLQLGFGHDVFKI